MRGGRWKVTFGKATGVYEEGYGWQVMGKAVEVYGTKTQQVIGRGGNVPDADFGCRFPLGHIIHIIFKRC